MCCGISCGYILYITLQWRHNGRDGVSNHQPHHCLLNRLFRSRSKKTSKLPVTDLCAGNSPVTGEFPAQMASKAEYVSIWWHDTLIACNQKECCSQTQRTQHNVTTKSLRFTSTMYLVELKYDVRGQNGITVMFGPYFNSLWPGWHVKMDHF